MTCSKFFLVLLMQVFILSSFANGNEITFSSLLQEMTNRESLVDYPSPYYTVRQFSSYDLSLIHICGLMRYNRQTDSFDIIPELVGIFVYDIKEDTSGNLWLATYVCGVFRYDVSKKEWKNYVHNEKDEKSLSHNKVCLLYTSRCV